MTNQQTIGNYRGYYYGYRYKPLRPPIKSEPDPEENSPVEDIRSGEEEIYARSGGKAGIRRNTAPAVGVNGKVADPRISALMAYDEHIFEGKKILDVGCNVGLLTFTMAAMGGMDVHGIDIDPKLVKIANRTLQCVKDSGFITIGEHDPAGTGQQEGSCGSGIQLNNDNRSSKLSDLANNHDNVCTNHSEDGSTSYGIDCSNQRKFRSEVDSQPRSLSALWKLQKSSCFAASLSQGPTECSSIAQYSALKKRNRKTLTSSSCNITPTVSLSNSASSSLGAEVAPTHLQPPAKNQEHQRHLFPRQELSDCTQGLTCDLQHSEAPLFQELVASTYSTVKTVRLFPTNSATKTGDTSQSFSASLNQYSGKEISPFPMRKFVQYFPKDDEVHRLWKVIPSKKEADILYRGKCYGKSDFLVSNSAESTLNLQAQQANLDPHTQQNTFQENADQQVVEQHEYERDGSQKIPPIQYPGQNIPQQLVLQKDTHQQVTSELHSSKQNTQVQYIYGLEPPPQKNEFIHEYPYNISFAVKDCTDSSLFLSSSSQSYPLASNDKYNIIVAFSITKWLHMNEGDEGIRNFFRLVHSLLEDGGLFIVEPQSWQSYRKKRRIMLKYREAIKSIQLKPEHFESFLKEGMGGFGRFELLSVLKCDESAALRYQRLFDRPIYIYKKF